MGVTVGLLDFYILEAGEYVDQLDALVGAAMQAPPESTPFIAAARALRGSSTMAKLLRMAELAGSVERVGRGLRDGSVQWSTEVRAALVAAIDDVRILLRTVRGWSAAEEQRAATRIAELRSFVPGSEPAQASTPISAAVSPAFFASEVEGVAAALDTYVAAPTDRNALDETLGRVRALRGIAALKDLPPLSDVADALETAAKTTMVDGRALSQQHAELYDASAHALRRAARELRTTGRPDATAPEVRRFAVAALALQQQSRDEDQVVPVASLFFSDAGPHIVSRADRSPAALETRFRGEATPLAEHLRRLVGDAKTATTSVARERISHELRGALRVIRWTIESFGEPDAARFFASAAAEANILDPIVLSSIDAAGALVASPTIPVTNLAARLEELGAQTRWTARLPLASARSINHSAPGRRRRRHVRRPAWRLVLARLVRRRCEATCRSPGKPRRRQRVPSSRSSSRAASRASPTWSGRRSLRQLRWMTRRSFPSTTCSIAADPHLRERSRSAI